MKGISSTLILTLRIWKGGGCKRGVRRKSILVWNYQEKWKILLLNWNFKPKLTFPWLPCWPPVLSKFVKYGLSIFSKKIYSFVKSIFPLRYTETSLSGSSRWNSMHDYVKMNLNFNVNVFIQLCFEKSSRRLATAIKSLKKEGQNQGGTFWQNITCLKKLSSWFSSA